MALLSKQLGIATLVISLTLVACGSEGAANEEGQARIDDIPPEVLDAIAAWGACRGRYVGEHIDEAVSAEALVEAALDRCLDKQQELDRVLTHQDGNRVGQVSNYRERAKTEMIAGVESIRAGQAPSDPNRAWGLCIGQNVPAEIGSDEFDSAFDNAVVACAAYEPAVRDWLAQTGGQTNVEANWQSYLDAIRSRARVEFLLP